MEPSIAPKPTVSEHACASSCRTDSSIVIESSSYEEKPKSEGIRLQLEDFIKLLDKGRFGLNEGANRGIEDVHDNHSQFVPLLNVDDNPPVIRRFGSLHTRVMLFREYELHNLEQELLALDRAKDRPNDSVLERKLYEERSWGGRTDLINRIDDKLREYHDAVQRARSFAALNKPAVRKSRFYPADSYQSLAQLEANTSFEDGDFISVFDRNSIRYDRRLQMAWSLFTECIPSRLFILKTNRRDMSAKPIMSASHIRLMVGSLIAITAIAEIVIAALVAPRILGSMPMLISMIFLFSIGFSVLFSIFTQAKRHEIFAATSAYCAVLVVFIGNTT